VPIPESGIAILDGRYGDTLFCLWPGQENVTSFPEGDDWQDWSNGWSVREPEIAAQCCTTSTTTDPDDCRRRSGPNGQFSDLNADCIAGVQGAGYEFVEMTYGQAVTACANKGLALCSQSCVGKGCGYNKNPVFSALPCPSPPSPPKAPSLSAIPESGIAILDGNALTTVGATTDTLFCLWPGDDNVTKANGTATAIAAWLAGDSRRQVEIAAQCCKSNSVNPIDSDDCRRRSGPNGDQSTSNADCIAGMTKFGSFKVMTYEEAVKLCDDYNLELCSQTCSGKGCQYNLNPVYSARACPWDWPQSFPPVV